MASWLKAAEDLFEVVDRRAKLVVGELSEEQSGTKLPASGGEQGKRVKSKEKAKKRPPADKRSKITEPVADQSLSEVSLSDVTPGRISISSEGTPILGPVSETSHEFRQTEQEPRSVPSEELPVEPPRNSVEKKDAAIAEVSTTLADVEVAVSTLDGRLDENEPDIPVEHPSSSLSEKEVEVSGEEHPTDVVQSSKSRKVDAVSNSDQEKTKTAIDESPLTGEIETHAEIKTGVSIKETKEHEQKAETAPTEVQDQLDEAQGLLKTTVSTGQSKEARLARVCAGLSSRLQEYKAENAQLEELLVAERELTKSYEAHIKQLQNDLSSSKSEVTKVESSMGEALAAKNKEIETLVNTMDALKKQAALNEGNLASLQANMESIMRNRELTETRMMQALREELASVERKAEEERAAHNASKMAAMERQVELEQRAVEASTALVRIQRTADERTTKVAELEQKVALLEVECSSLNQELQDMEARARRVQKKSPEDANQMIQIQALQEEVERARQGQRESENKLSILEAEMQKMRVEMAAMNRDAEHYSRQEHMELEKRYRELTDLLYYKQTQLETMSSEKAAAEFQLEKEIKRLQESQVEAERSRVSRRASASWEEETEIKALEPLPLYHRHMAAASVQLQKAAKLLDTGAVRATRFLWRYPTARLILLFYLVFVHLFLMYLLHRLQEQADSFAAKELAESMGLSNPNLP